MSAALGAATIGIGGWSLDVLWCLVLGIWSFACRGSSENSGEPKYVCPDIYISTVCCTRRKCSQRFVTTFLCMPSNAAA